MATHGRHFATGEAMAQASLSCPDSVVVAATPGVPLPGAPRCRRAREGCRQEGSEAFGIGVPAHRARSSSLAVSGPRPCGQRHRSRAGRNELEPPRGDAVPGPSEFATRATTPVVDQTVTRRLRPGPQRVAQRQRIEQDVHDRGGPKY